MKAPLFQAIQTKDSLTENGAITHSSSNDILLDLFFLAGACREIPEEEIQRKIQQAYSENQLFTLKIIFWAGDVRGGAGERRFFKVALDFLNKNYPEVLNKNINLVPHFNRWDSLFHLYTNDAVINYIAELLIPGQDPSLSSLNIGLLAKYLPRHTSKKFKELRKKLQKKLNLNGKEYRKLIVSLSNTVEQQISKKAWDKVDYSGVPSVAMNKYRKAFHRHDAVRFNDFIQKVSEGKEKINAGAIFPHDLYKAVIKEDNTSDINKAINIQWNNLPNYLENSQEKILPLVDVSGSMDMPDRLPISISIALGIYFSERNNSVFKDGFITFSRKPRLQYLKGTFSERVRQFDRQFAENTNLISAFKLILDKAKQNDLKQEDMPTTLLVISDMEFDSSCDDNQLTNYEKIQELYKDNGYELPRVVFWNVSSATTTNFPVKKDARAVLVSGASPSIIKAVLSADVNPVKVMIEAITNPRYDQITN